MVESNFIECNSIESFEDNSIDTSNLNNQQFSPIKISEIDDYFIAEIKETELILSKYISFFDYFDKVVVFLLHPLQQLLEHLQEYQVQLLVSHFHYVQD